MKRHSITTFGARLLRFKDERGLPISALARQFSVDPNFVRMLLRGARHPGREMLARFCAAFGEPVERWAAVIRWEKERNPAVKKLLEESILAGWPEPPSAEGLPHALLDPVRRVAWPVLGRTEAEHLLRAIVQSEQSERTAAFGDGTDSIAPPEAVWVQLDVSGPASDCLSPGDLLLIEPARRIPAVGLAGSRLVLALLDGELVALRCHDEGDFYTLCPCTRPETRRTVPKVPGLPIFPVRAVFHRNA